jgi:predicted ATPase
LFEALERLGREPDSEQLLAVLRRVAPMWLAHLPTLVALDELERLQHQIQGMGAERMLRQLVEALAVMTRDTVLVLVLEDLQWSDTSTVEFLTYIARRADHLRLLVIGIYRPAELIALSHPLRQIVQELVVHKMCQVLRLEFLNVEEVQAYMAQRLGMPPTLTALGTFVHQRTEGNALFMVHILDHLIQQGWLVEVNGQWHFRDDVADVAGTVPENLRPLLVRQVEALNADEQRILDIASVIGFHFTAAEVAAILPSPVEAVEDICDGLAQQESFIEAMGTTRWPKDAATIQYGFRHMLYRDVLYARLGMAQRRRLHVLVGEHLEARYGVWTREIAGELAIHFERGQDTWRAVQYQQYAAEQALCRHAYTEALAHGNRGLELLATLPESPECMIRELSLRLPLSIALTGTQGYTSEALADNLHRALALCDAVESTTQLVPLL